MSKGRSIVVVSAVLNMLAGIHLVQEYSFEFLPSVGESMLPTINNQRDYLIISTRYRRGRNIHMGDVVSCFKPSEPSNRVCKRVTGMPGDFVLLDPASPSLLANPDEFLSNYGIFKYSPEIPRVSPPKKVKELTRSEQISLVESLQDALEQNENYQNDLKKEYNKYFKVPAGHCWLTGDDLSWSLDSRDYGVVPMALITGKIQYALMITEPLKPWTWKLRKIGNSFETIQ